MLDLEQSQQVFGRNKNKNWLSVQMYNIYALQGVCASCIFPCVVSLLRLAHLTTACVHRPTQVFSMAPSSFSFFFLISNFEGENILISKTPKTSSALVVGILQVRKFLSFFCFEIGMASGCAAYALATLWNTCNSELTGVGL